MRLSDQGADFIARHEGFVSKAYRDPVGVVTIGTGFTNRSRVALEMLGPIKLGMTISRAQNDAVLRRAVDTEYGPPVTENIAPKFQHEYDGCCSVSFNCGPKATTWAWARALAARKVKEAAALLRVTATTAGGRKLRGLVRRRAEEARLIQAGDYGTGGHPSFAPAAERVAATPSRLLKDYQAKLKRLGFDPGPIDGLRGPKTTAAVRRLQQSHPQLVVDGILSRATMAQIDRAIDLTAKSKTMGVVGTGGIAVGTGAAEALSFDWTLVLAIGTAATVVLLGILVWRYRDEIKALISTVRR